MAVGLRVLAAVEVAGPERGGELHGRRCHGRRRGWEEDGCRRHARIQRSGEPLRTRSEVASEDREEEDAAASEAGGGGEEEGAAEEKKAGEVTNVRTLNTKVEDDC